jgi:hypothetical protein
MLQGHLINIMITNVDTLTNQHINIVQNKDNIQTTIRRILIPVQLGLKIEVILGITMQKILSKDPIKAQFHGVPK